MKIVASGALASSLACTSEPSDSVSSESSATTANTSSSTGTTATASTQGSDATTGGSSTTGSTDVLTGETGQPTTGNTDTTGTTGASESTGETAATSEGGETGVAVRFAEVFEPVFVQRGCTSGYCHGAGAGGLDLVDEATAYANLVEIPAAAAVCGLSVRVVPGDPEQSILWRRVRPAALDAGDMCAPKMPQGSMGLADADAALVESWIAGGALD